MAYHGYEPAKVAVEVGDGSISTAKIAADAVTNAKIADNAVDTEHLADDAIEAAELASDAVVNASVASGAAIAYSKLGAIPTFNQNTTGNAATVTTNANLTGEVTSSGNTTTIAGNIVDEANLKVSNTPTDGHMLTAQSGNTGGLTWAAAPSETVAVTPPNLYDAYSYFDVNAAKVHGHANTPQDLVGRTVDSYTSYGGADIQSTGTPPGRHMHYDGSGEFHDPSGDEWSDGNTKTLLVIFNSNSVSGEKAIAGHLRGDGTGWPWNDYGKGIGRNGSSLFAMAENNNDKSLATTTIVADKWYFAVGRFDTVANKGGLSYCNYTDGDDLTISTHDLDSGYAYKPRIGGTRSIASQGDDHESGNWFIGEIDVVIWWGRTLTNAEVTNCCEWFRPRFGPTQT